MALTDFKIVWLTANNTKALYFSRDRHQAHQGEAAVLTADIHYLHHEGDNKYCIGPTKPVAIPVSNIQEKNKILPYQITNKCENEQIFEISEEVRIEHDSKQSVTHILPIYLNTLFQQESAQFLIPHPMNTKGGGKPTATLPLLVFSDETSGNTTKKWNRLETFSMSFAGLLRKDIRKTENIHFLGTSNIVPSVPLGQSIANDLKGTYIYKMATKTKISKVHDVYSIPLLPYHDFYL